MHLELAAGVQLSKNPPAFHEDVRGDRRLIPYRLRPECRGIDRTQACLKVLHLRRHLVALLASHVIPEAWHRCHSRRELAALDELVRLQEKPEETMNPIAAIDPAAVMDPKTLA